MLLPLRWFCCAALLLVSATAAMAQSAGQGAPSRTVRPGVLVFKLKAEAAGAKAGVGRPGPAALPAALTTTFQALGATARPKFAQAAAPTAARAQAGAVDLGLLYELTLPAGTSPEQLQRRLLKTGLVEYAEPLYNYQPLQQPNDPQADSAGTGGQYYLRNIRAHQAWNITQGDTSVVIGIIDGGTRFSHEDLTGQNQLNRRDPIDGIDNDGDGYVDNYYGWDFADHDNDPERLRNATDLTHGILVTGIAAAATNNGRGIAGVGYKSRYMPLKIYPSTPEGSFGGYEAIVYAADHDCRVINLSWGGVGAPSRFEQDVISYAALNHDVLIVAAAGNTPQDLDFYPASYQHVVSVAFTARSDERSTASTFSYRVDVSAPGEGIITTLGLTDTDYAKVGGSSFATPQVAGAAALVRARFPQLNAAQVAAQLRRTTDFIDNLPGNLAYAGRLGSGRLNAFRAVSEQPYSARVVARTAAPARTFYQPADTLRLSVRVQNLLRALPGLTVTLTSLSPHLLVRRGEFVAGPLATLAATDNVAAPFRLAVAATGVPLNTTAVLRYHLHHEASGYSEDQYETLLLNPDYVVLDANNLRLTLTSRGNLGYDALNPSLGEGITYRQGPPLLAEGGLLLATSATRLASNVRNDKRGNDADFITVAQVHRLPAANGAATSQRVEGRLREEQLPPASPLAVGVALRQRATARAAAPHQNYVLLEYQLTNITADTLRPLHLGLFMDWDLPDNPTRNVANWDAARRLGYVYDTPGQTIYAGVQHLAGGQASVFSLDNGSNIPAGPVRLNDGFSRAEKWLTLSSGTTYASTGLTSGTDAAQVVGAMLPYLAPADSVTVAFAVLAAPSLAELQVAADAATTGYQQVPTATKAGLLAGIRLYPNPTAGPLRLELPAGPATVRVLSVLGQQLAAYTLQQPTASLDLSAYPAGLYLIQVQTAAGAATYRILKRP